MTSHRPLLALIRYVASCALAADAFRSQAADAFFAARAQALAQSLARQMRSRVVIAVDGVLGGCKVRSRDEIGDKASRVPVQRRA
jgi:hypothetical protein